MRIRSIFVGIVAAFGLAVGLTGSGVAGPFEPEPFQTLRGELTNRRDNDFSGTLDATQKKQQKAVIKALATLDKTSKSFSTDLKNAGKIVKSLAKVYPDEFVEISAIATLRDVADFMFNRLHDIVAEDISALDGDVSGLSTKGQAKVGALVDAGENAIADARGSDFTDWQKALIAGYKAFLKGRKLADNDKPDTGGKQFLKATIGGQKWESDNDTRTAVYNSFGGLLVITGTKVGLPAKNLSITPVAVAGTGTFTISVGTYNELGFPTKSYLASNTGTLTITTFDTVNLRIAGTFSFTATGVAGTTGNVVITGEFDIVYVNGGA
jgi:hypothetical protein